MDLQIAGSWAGYISGNSSRFSLPQVNGSVQLHNVRATLRGVNGPIEISSAELQLLPDEVRVEKLRAQAGGADWTGSVGLPRGCGMPGACLVRFDLEYRRDWAERTLEMAGFAAKPAPVVPDADA